MPRIVSLVPSLTKTLIDLGAEASVVGRTDFCPDGEDPSPVRVGGTKEPDLDLIAALDPEVVLAVKEENEKAAVVTLRERGIPVVVYDPRRVTEAPGLAWSLSRIAEVPEAGTRMSKHLADAVREAQRRSGRRPPVRVAYLVWGDPFMIAGPETWIADVVRCAGGKDVLPPAERRYPEVEPGDLVAAGAEVVLFSSEPYPFGDRHIDEFRDRAGLGPGEGPRLLPCRGDLVGWYPSHVAAGLAHLEGLLTEM